MKQGVSLLSRLGKNIQHLRSMLSRSEWVARHLYHGQHSKEEHAVDSPGVLMIQIDGLSYDNFLRAIDKKQLVFLHTLLQKDSFVLRQFYSGLPSSTPAVQAELFYGVKSSVPAFSYFNRDTKKEHTMYDAETADIIAHQLSHGRKNLLEGGSSYSNIFTGGAAKAPFCIQSMKLDSIFYKIKLRRILLYTLINIEKVLRIAGLSLLETGLAVYDFFKGILQRKNPFKEFKFIFSRIGASIVLREIVRVHVKIDIARGLPIIHANFIGYDEHAHRRNPDSAFAHWTLKGLDATIQSLVLKAMRSEKRDYTIFIYSDHGQEVSQSFSSHAGKTLHEAIQEAFVVGKLANCRYQRPDGTLPNLNLHKRSKGLFRKSSAAKRPVTSNSPKNGRIHITAMGPLGHIYLPVDLSAEEKQCYAERLVKIGQIPLVCYCHGSDVICTWQSRSGELNESASKIFGKDHPFLEEVKDDMKRICNHPHAGDFIISGWRTDAQPVTFPLENGSHGGPGSNETRGFAILPDILAGSQSFLRPLDLRDRVLSALKNNLPVPQHLSREDISTPQVISVMTYNIHSCIGLDGKLFTKRIARIIDRHAPDIIALQEVDNNMERTKREDQAALIADQLGMHYSYFPVLQKAGHQYGLALLTHYPFEKEEFIYLPQQKRSQSTEKRGILLATLTTPQGPLHLLNTHLSLMRNERLMQMQFIVKNDLLTRVAETDPVIFCGDLNATKSSVVYSLLSRKLQDSQAVHTTNRADATFFSTWPIFRLDYIFHSSQLVPVSVHVIDDRECRISSDHLPVIARFLHAPHMKN